jgi:Protein of unknown function (DUF2742)
VTAEQPIEETRPFTGAGSPASRQVSWFEVYAFAERFATSHGVGADNFSDLPLPGTPRWCGMSDDDAAKLLALVLGGVREALNHEVTQEHQAQASHAVAAAADWPAISRAIRQRAGSYIPRRSA